MSDTDPSLLGKSTPESVSEIRLDTEMVIENFDGISLDPDREIHETNRLPAQKHTHLGNDTKQLENNSVNAQLEQSGLQNQDSASDGVATNSKTEEIPDDDEGFGDFGDFNEEGGFDDFQEYNSSSFVTHVPPTVADTYPQFETITGDKEVEDRLDKMVKDMDMDPLIYAKLKSAFPVFHIQPMEVVAIPNIEVEPLPEFKWNTSRLKQIMEKALLNTRKEVKQALESPKVNEENIEDVRTRQLQNAKQLLEVTEDDLQTKSKDELQDFIRSLNDSLIALQEQVNYWNEAKEQLLVDAEMHNKMIANLVTYAKEQQGIIY